MNIISRNLTEDCVLTFVNGDTVRGAKDVGNLILSGCEYYNYRYIRGFISGLSRGLAVGVGVGIVGIVTVKAIKNRKLKKSYKEEA